MRVTNEGNFIVIDRKNINVVSNIIPAGPVITWRKGQYKGGFVKKTIILIGNVCSSSISFLFIKASDEQVDQLGDTGNYLAVKFLNQGTYFDEVTVDNITELSEEETEHNNKVTINLNADEKLETSGDIEVYLRKTVVIKSDEDTIVKIEE